MKKRIVVAIAGAAAAATLAGGVGFAANPVPGLDKEIACASAKAKVTKLQQMVAAAPAGSDKKALLQALLAQARTERNKACR